MSRPATGSLAAAAQACGCRDRDSFAETLRIASLGQSPVDEILDGELVEEDAFLQKLAAELHLEWLEKPVIDSEARRELARLVPASLALRRRVLPLGIEYSSTPEPTATFLRLGHYDPFDLIARQVVAREIDLPVRWVLTGRKHLLAGLQAFYGVGAATFEKILQGRAVDLSESSLQDETHDIDDGEDEEASVVKFVNQIIREALAQRATDIHLEPMAENLRIRYRIDGQLQDVPVPENIKSLQASVIARVKVMARLDIAEKRKPQDGRISLSLEDHAIDVRVATIPSVEGESISLRLLGQESFNLKRLELLPDVRQQVDHLLAQSNGIVLVTGPTGSGKSTSLYSFLTEINRENVRIVTIEDPVENKLEGIVQIAVKPEVDLTFATGLRSILRGDPNVIMVGEIRDVETAEIAIRSALTGHLVFSTLHTNDAIGGITRLVDMGVEPFLVGASVRAFIAQRLVRRLCPDCRVPVDHDEEHLWSMGFKAIPDAQIFAPGGCDNCRGTGFRGRIAIFEVCVVTPRLKEHIVNRSPQGILQQTAVADGFIPMRDYGWRKVCAGETTIEEIISVTTEEGS